MGTVHGNSAAHAHQIIGMSWTLVRGKTLLSEKNDRGPKGTISCIIVSPGVTVFIALGYSLPFLLGNITNISPWALLIM